MYIIGVLGENGAGKGTFILGLTDQLRRHNLTFQVQRFSDVLAETLDGWGLPRTRENFQKMAQSMRAYYGDAVLSTAVKRRAENANVDVVILDGVRWLTDEEMIRSFARGSIIYVTAPPKLRYERMKARGEKVGESELSYKEFLVNEEAPNEIEIPDIGLRANLIVNNIYTTFEQLIEPAAEFVEWHILGR